ncbi:hypothetical protein PSHT_02572 [Puccinia striiformis]|uniref:C2 domain-containing protein n=1 Tax=Puccinia striiformis TaxID=27350 RepID=A0A2S4WHP0_9BASI|nr:hypothetical protein PSHT_02572 [Puccinia striiformis]
MLGERIIKEMRATKWMMILSWMQPKILQMTSQAVIPDGPTKPGYWSPHPVKYSKLAHEIQVAKSATPPVNRSNLNGGRVTLFPPSPNIAIITLNLCLFFLIDMGPFNSFKSTFETGSKKDKVNLIRTTLDNLLEKNPKLSKEELQIWIPLLTQSITNQIHLFQHPSAPPLFYTFYTLFLKYSNPIDGHGHVIIGEKLDQVLHLIRKTCPINLIGIWNQELFSPSLGLSDELRSWRIISKLLVTEHTLNPLRKAIENENMDGIRHHSDRIYKIFDKPTASDFSAETRVISIGLIFHLIHCSNIQGAPDLGLDIAKSLLADYFLLYHEKTLLQKTLDEFPASPSEQTQPTTTRNHTRMSSSLLNVWGRGNPIDQQLTPKASAQSGTSKENNPFDSVILQTPTGEPSQYFSSTATDSLKAFSNKNLFDFTQKPITRSEKETTTLLNLPPLGLLSVKIIQAQSLKHASSRSRPYVFAQFDNNEFTSREPISEEEEEARGVSLNKTATTTTPRSQIINLHPRISTEDNGNGFCLSGQNPVWKQEVDFDVTHHQPSYSTHHSLYLSIYDRSLGDTTTTTTSQLSNQSSSVPGIEGVEAFLGETEIKLDFDRLRKANHAWVDQWYPLTMKKSNSDEEEGERSIGKIRIQLRYSEFTKTSQKKSLM